ncbi:MAG: PorP/SprF family type IX secretion system membrane protein [Bacteroidales bacterium]|nr:PorP/SprF family type IX secretion system membrane protein [Bacteroidales bacterium]
MNFKYLLKVRKKCFATLILTSVMMLPVFSQQTPLYPLFHRMVSPFIFNPAIAGSKDFFSVDISAGKFGKANSQLVSGNMRLSKKPLTYHSSPPIPQFTNIGVGAYLFSDFDGATRKTGFGATGSYHFPLDKDGLSFISAGVTAKVIYNDYAGNTDLGEAPSTKFFPDFDAGLYYYSPTLYAGISATNLMGTPSNSDTLSTYTIPVSRQLFFMAGYKIVLSRQNNIVLEPLIILNSDDSFSGEVLDMIQPALKLYAGNFCAGTYFNDFDRLSFFFQYKYNSFYVGAYFSLPHNEPFYKSPLIEEIAVGINLSSIKSGISRMYHW